jgi:hypothetical protein
VLAVTHVVPAGGKRHVLAPPTSASPNTTTSTQAKATTSSVAAAAGATTAVAAAAATTSTAAVAQSTPMPTPVGVVTTDIVSFSSAEISLNASYDQISAIRITALAGAYGLVSISTSAFVQPPAPTTTPPSTLATTTPVLTSTTAGNGLTPALVPAPIDVEQRIKNGFAGNDTTALGAC